MTLEGRQVFETFTEARLPAMEEGGQKKLYSKSRSRCRGLYNLPTVLYRSRDRQSPVKQQAMGQLAGLSDRGGIGGVSILVAFCVSVALTSEEASLHGGENVRNARSRTRVVAILHAKDKPREFQVFKTTFFFFLFPRLTSYKKGREKALGRRYGTRIA